MAKPEECPPNSSSKSVLALDKYYTLFSSFNEGYALIELIYDKDGKPVDFLHLEVDADQKITGLRSNAGRRMSEMGVVEQYWLEMYARVISTGVPERIEHYAESLRRWKSVLASRVGGPGSHLIAAVFDDITERKRRESELRESERRKDFSLSLNDGLRSISSSVDIQAKSAMLVGEYLKAGRSFYYTVEREAGGYVYVIQNHYCRNSELSATIGRLSESMFGNRLMGNLANGETLIVPNITQELSLTPDEVKFYLSTDIYSLVAVPLIKKGKYVAGIMIEDFVPRQWNTEEIKVIEETLERTWAAVEKAKADEVLRASEARLQQLNARLQEMDRSKTEFFNNVSHEIRTPLTLLMGPLDDVLQKNKSNLHPDDLLKLQLAHRNALRLRKLVNTLLDFARTEAGKIEAFYQPTDFTKVTLDLAANFRSAIESAGLKLVIKTENINEPVYLNREMWEKIVFNILSNALKFTHKGKIQVVIHEKNRSIEFRVKDTGVGIPKKYINRIFERFVRVESSKGRTSEGTGIGLALVRELVWAHKGNIKVRSEEGEGSEFIVTLLKGKSHLDPKQVFENKKQLPSALSNDSFVDETLTWLPEDDGVRRKQERNYHQNEKIRILLADDNTDMRNYLSDVLSEKYNVLALQHGRKVVDFLEKGGQVDLIIVDVMMPEMNGYELVDFLKSNPKYQDIPIIMLSARATEEARIIGLNIGADDYLMKPFSPAELRALINSRVTKARRSTVQE